MSNRSADPESKTVQYVFGAGYVFGVFSTMLVLVVVLAVVAGRSTLDLLAPSILLAIGLATVIAVGIGSALFLLAFPENRVKVPVIGDGTEEFE